MGIDLRRLLARAVLLWLLAWYLAALLGMTAGPGVLAWHWFRDGVAPEIAVVLTLIAATMPIILSAWAASQGGIWQSRLLWRVWVFGWALTGWALIFAWALT